MKRFNDLYDLVEEDRAFLQVAAVEKEFLDYCVEEGNDKKAGGRQMMNQLPLRGQPACCSHAIFGRRGIWIMSSEHVY